MSEPLLDVQELRVRFQSDFGDRIVTDDISFHVNQGEILGIVGESGSGKSVSCLAVMGLLSRNGAVLHGKALYQGRDLLTIPEKELDKIRGNEISMVFQDALASLDPVLTVETQIAESLKKHLGMSRKEAAARALVMLEKAGIPDPAAVMKKYPHELSGGMRQRVMIAMALCCHPKLLIADEPTTALDVTIQAQIMQMIRRIRADLGMSVILITHDIGLVAQMADRVMVMYAGQIIEETDVYALYRNPMHPYTRMLLDAAPSIDDSRDRRIASIKGTVPENYTELTGCRFMDRCPFAGEGCSSRQEMTEIEAGHLVRCHKASELAQSRREAADGTR
ncbi:MAG: ABC transporter ATP-binding protein [Lachnospiraceae bacterium]|nr:ABC transporter ATP-binding protein [Lachnospiraceae bacterium]